MIENFIYVIIILLISKKEKIIENHIKFTIALDNLNAKITELNIKISKDLSNENLKNELSILLNDREKLLKESDIVEIEKILNKYGSSKNNG